MKIAKISALIMVSVLLLCGCSDGIELDGGRWYIDDINNTVRTVASFDEESGMLQVSYVLIDEGRAERTGVDGLQYVFEEYYFKDFGKNIPAKYNDGALDEYAFAVYHSKEELKSDENASVTYYHFEDKNLVVNGNECIFLEGVLAEETDKIIARNKAAIGE